MPYFEDLESGEKLSTQARTITDGMASLLINVGGYTAPFFNDEIAANKTPLGWRALPGRMILALMGGLLETYGSGRPTTEAPSGTALFVGVHNMRVRIPLKVGDTVHLESERVELVETSNPRWGRVIDRETLINQRGEVVCEADIIHLYERRPK
jgi:acyl dehydratase